MERSHVRGWILHRALRTASNAELKEGANDAAQGHALCRTWKYYSPPTKIPREISRKTTWAQASSSAMKRSARDTENAPPASI